MALEETSTSAPLHAEPRQFRHLVLDAAPLIKFGNLSSGIADHFHTTPEVLAEIKDAASRDALERLPFQLETKSPSLEASKLVQVFAKASGDIAVLSPTDVKILALAVSLDLEVNGEASKIRREPRAPKINESSGGSSAQYSGARKESDGKKSEKRRRGGQEVASFDDEPSKGEEADVIEDEVESASDAGEWITPDNIDKFRGQSKWTTQTTASPNEHSKPTNKNRPSTQQIPVALVSSDFAVQNVALQMGLRLFSPDGIRIKRLQNWLLRCHACYALTRDMERRFCPKCGGPTLLRTSYSVNAQGQTILHLRADFQYNLRGSKYSLPNPKTTTNKQQQNQAGKKIFLREDQADYERALRTYQRQQRKAEKGVSLDVVDDRLAGLFGEMKLRNGDGTAKAYFEGIAPPVIGFGRRNPNQVRRTAK